MRKPIELRAAYHDACHLAHAQGIRMQPRELLRGIPGLELLEPAEWELCCGSAGIYNLLQPEAAGKLGARKAENLRATGAEAIAAANPGCALQIAPPPRPPDLSPDDPARHVTQRSSTVSKVQAAAPPAEGSQTILSDDALAFVGELQERFGARRAELLQARAERGAPSGFLPGDRGHPRRRLAGPAAAARTTRTAAPRSPARPTASSSSTRSTAAPRASWPTSRTRTRRPGATRSRAT